MSSTLLHLIALLFAVRAGAWKACACIPCAACAASETDCLLGSCLLFLSALLFLQQQHLLSSVAFSCCCRSHCRWHLANLLFMSSTLLHLIALLFAVQAGAWKACTCIPCAGYFSTLLSHSLPLRKFQLRTRLHLMSVLLLPFPAAWHSKSCPAGSLQRLDSFTASSRSFPAALHSKSCPAGSLQEA